jgi:hypothetical protein
MVVSGCGSSSGGQDMSTGNQDLTASSGSDLTMCAAGALSRCGHPCDVGNTLGVGQYCKTGTDCSGNSMAKICSSLLNGATPSADDTYFCTFQCDPGMPDSQCGPNAKCSCMAGAGCGCTPDRCVQSTG